MLYRVRNKLSANYHMKDRSLLVLQLQKSVIRLNCEEVKGKLFD